MYLFGNLLYLKRAIIACIIYLYMYMYDPKLKATLPYYDRFPLVFPFSKTPDGFIGLNMHYLPYQLRMVLLDRLLTFRTNARMDETTRLRYS